MSIASHCNSLHDKRSKIQNVIKKVLKPCFGMLVWPFPHCSILPIWAVIRSAALFITIGDAWMPVLSIPVIDCNCCSLKLLKWLRFLGYAIHGCIGSMCLANGGYCGDFVNCTATASWQGLAHVNILCGNLSLAGIHCVLTVLDY
jgi:hypothetical protein